MKYLFLSLILLFQFEAYTQEYRRVQPNRVKPNRVKPNRVKPNRVRPNNIQPHCQLGGLYQSSSACICDGGWVAQESGAYLCTNARCQSGAMYQNMGCVCQGGWAKGINPQTGQEFYKCN